jgi:hypothetical protein
MAAITINAPCVVPAPPANITLAAMTNSFATAHCAAGKVTYHANRRGRVITLTAPRNKHLSPRAKVGIVLSSGQGG